MFKTLLKRKDQNYWIRACEHHDDLLPEIKETIITALLKRDKYIKINIDNTINESKQVIRNLVTLVRADFDYYDFRIVEINDNQNKVEITAEIKYNENIFYESSRWDMDISFEELIKHNKLCYVDREYKSHKHDEGCYDGYCLYLKHPNNVEYSLMIGIREDGFMYIGEGKKCENATLEDTKYVIKEMMKYREFMEIKLENMRRV